MRLTYYGHSCFEVKLQSKTLLFDPFITPNKLAAHIKQHELSPNYILISHGHNDHLADAETIAARTCVPIISNYEIVHWFGLRGLDSAHPMNLGGSWTFDFGTVKYVNAVHSSMLPDGSNGGNAGGFVITSQNRSFYYAGDTALTRDMELIGDQFNLDFAILPIGDNFTMGPSDAAIAANMLKVKRVIGVHYDTFPLIKIDHAKAKAIFAKADIELVLIPIGESVDL